MVSVYWDERAGPTASVVGPLSIHDAAVLVIQIAEVFEDDELLEAGVAFLRRRSESQDIPPA